MSASDYLEGKLKDHVLRGLSYTPPTTLYLALYTSAPNDAGGGTEVSGGGYIRQAVTVSGTYSNSNIVQFPNTGWAGTIVAIALFDASSGGNFLIWNTITSTAVASGEQPVFNVGTLSFTAD